MREYEYVVYVASTVDLMTFLHSSLMMSPGTVFN